MYSGVESLHGMWFSFMEVWLGSWILARIDLDAGLPTTAHGRFWVRASLVHGVQYEHNLCWRILFPCPACRHYGRSRLSYFA